MRQDKAAMRQASFTTLKSRRYFFFSFLFLPLILVKAPAAWPEESQTLASTATAQSIVKPILFGFDNVHQIFENCSGGRTAYEKQGLRADSSGMRWDIAYQPGQSSFCKRRYNARRFKGGERMRFYARSTIAGFILVELEEEKGEVFYSIVPVGTAWAPVFLDLSSFKVRPDTRQDGVLDRKKILRVILEDPFSFFGAKGVRTVWFSDWFVEAFDIPFKSRPYYLGFMQWPTVGAFRKQIPVSDELIREHGDLIAFHIDGAVPWLEALDNRLNASPALMQAIGEARAKISRGRRFTSPSTRLTDRATTWPLIGTEQTSRRLCLLSGAPIRSTM